MIPVSKYLFKVYNMETITVPFKVVLLPQLLTFNLYFFSGGGGGRGEGGGCPFIILNFPIYLQPLTTRDIVLMALQIAKGLQYLGRRRIIHTDVATRNCV